MYQDYINRMMLKIHKDFSPYKCNTKFTVIVQTVYTEGWKIEKLMREM